MKLIKTIRVNINVASIHRSIVEKIYKSEFTDVKVNSDLYCYMVKDSYH